MTATLLRFGFVMVVVMIGFAMALHVLFRDLDTFGQTFLHLFKAMLGDTAYFDEFSGERYDWVATILLVVYLFIVAIMLLNLLVAILSTSHAQVQDNVGREFKVAKARIVQHYRLVVDEDVLPAPFNLVQLAVSPFIMLLCYLCGCSRGANNHGTLRQADQSTERETDDRSAANMYRCARRAFGQVVFWLLLGPIAVAGGALLWVISGFPYAQYAFYTLREEEIDFIIYRLEHLTEINWDDEGVRGWLLHACCYIGIFLWCIAAAPLCLLGLWVKASARVLAPCCFEKNSNGDRGSSRRVSKPTIESMLTKGPGGVGADKLREFLEDPMNDDDVRQDEKDRPTMVEHIKLLRNRLETTTKNELKELRNNVASKMEVHELQRNVATKSEVQELQNQLNQIFLVVKGLEEKIGRSELG